MSIFARSLFAMGLLAGAVSVALGSSFTFTTINNPSGTMGTTAVGINNIGQIVGVFTDAGGNNHAYVDNAGIFKTTDVPGCAATEAFGINDAGNIVGTFTDGSGNSHGFLLSGGSFTTLDDPTYRARDA